MRAGGGSATAGPSWSSSRARHTPKRDACLPRDRLSLGFRSRPGGVEYQVEQVRDARVGAGVELPQECD